MTRSISSVPLESSSPARITFDTQVKEAIETLQGVRGNSGAKAVLASDITVAVAAISKAATDAQGIIITDSNGIVSASGVDYVKLVQDVRVLIQDVARLRDSVALLVSQMRG